MHRTFCLAVPAALLLATGASLAQQPVPAGRVPGGQQQPTREENRPPMPVIDVEFAGGPVREFIKAVQKASMESAAKTPVNVMVPAEAAEVSLPAVSLKRVSAETALETLRYAFGMQGQHSFEARNMTNEGDEGLTFAVQYAPGRGSAQMQPMGPMPQVLSEAYSLRDLIDTPEGMPQSDPGLRMSADAVLGALKLAAELEATDARVTPTQLLFHRDTQLLIARGTPDQQRLVMSVLQQLRATMEQRRERFADAQSRERNDQLQKIEMEAQIKHAQAQLDRAMSELGPAEAEVQRIGQLLAAGSASKTEQERAQANLDVARANVRAAETNLMMQARRREVLESTGGPAGGAHGDVVVAIYDVRDLKDFKGEFHGLVKQVIGREGSMEVRAGAGDPTGSLVVRAPRDRHEILVSIFNTARRLKSNEPKLPGQTLEQLIDKSKE